MGARTRNYKNTKTRFDLTPFQLVPYTTAKEREEYYDIERMSICQEHSGTIGWVLQTIVKMCNMRRAEAESSH